MPGIGTKHRCILDKGQEILYTSSFSYDPDKRIVFSETDEKRKTSIYYVIDKIDDDKSRLTIEYYQRRDGLAQFMFNLFVKKKMEARYERSLANMEGLLREIELPVEF